MKLRQLPIRTGILCTLWNRWSGLWWFYPLDFLHALDCPDIEGNVIITSFRGAVFSEYPEGDKRRNQ